MTESCSSLTFMTLHDPFYQNSTISFSSNITKENENAGVLVGKPAPHIELRNGWLNTGDVGWIDGNGDLWLVGHKKDRIKSRGENIYPEEVETMLSQHPGVLKAVVIGIPNSRLGEMVVACIIIRDRCKWSDINSSDVTGVNDLSTKILQKYCQQQKLSRPIWKCFSCYGYFYGIDEMGGDFGGTISVGDQASGAADLA